MTTLASAMRLTSSIVVVTSFCIACRSETTSTPSSPIPLGDTSQTLVAVYAHPDDETIVSPALTRYAREGAKVYLVVATDGRLGVSEHAKIPAGDSLATVRAAEVRCSARELGINPPILVGLPDAGLAVISPWPGEPLDRLAKRLDSVFTELRPDAVFTWGPEGGYGHADHRLVGDVVTQVFQSGTLTATTRLFFAGFAPDRTADAPTWYGFHVYPTASALLTASVPFDSSHLAAARRALGCHRSQATQQQMDSSFAALQHLWNGRVSFQQWRGAR